MNRVVKDSANNYTLYVDKGSDFTFTVDLDSTGLLPEQEPDLLDLGNGDSLILNEFLDELSVEDTSPSENNTEYMTEVIVTSTAAKHHTSKKKYEFSVQKSILDRSLSLKLDADTTNSMTDNMYNFTVFTRFQENTSVLFSGTIIINNTIN